jgi:hypothetical protein
MTLRSRRVAECCPSPLSHAHVAISPTAGGEVKDRKSRTARQLGCCVRQQVVREQSTLKVLRRSSDTNLGELVTIRESPCRIDLWASGSVGELSSGLAGWE